MATLLLQACAAAVGWHKAKVVQVSHAVTPALSTAPHAVLYRRAHQLL